MMELWFFRLLRLDHCLLSWLGILSDIKVSFMLTSVSTIRCVTHCITTCVMECVTVCVPQVVEFLANPDETVRHYEREHVRISVHVFVAFSTQC